MKRREFLGLSVGGAIAALSSRAQAQASLKEIRIGYQKTGVLVIARQQAVLEKRFAGKQIGVSDFFLCIVTHADYTSNNSQRFDRRTQLCRCE